MSKRAADLVTLREMIDEVVAYFISMMLAGRQRIWPCSGRWKS
jgi:hypothetical protein